MNEIVMNRLKRQIIKDLTVAFVDLPHGHSMSLHICDDLISLADWDKYEPGEDNSYKIWIMKGGEFDPIQFANDAEIMLSMIHAKMEVAE